MSAPDPVVVLNRLLQTVYRSLPIYLQVCPPWSSGGEGPGTRVLGTIAADRQELAQRIAGEIQELGGPVEPGQFPRLFTSLNDVSLDYILDQVRQGLCADLETFERSIAQLTRLPAGRWLAEEALEQTRRHLTLLAELRAEKAGK